MKKMILSTYWLTDSKENIVTNLINDQWLVTVNISNKKIILRLWNSLKI